VPLTLPPTVGAAGAGVGAGVGTVARRRVGFGVVARRWGVGSRAAVIPGSGRRGAGRALLGSVRMIGGSLVVRFGVGSPKHTMAAGTASDAIAPPMEINWAAVKLATRGARSRRRGRSGNVTARMVCAGQARCGAYRGHGHLHLDINL